MYMHLTVNSQGHTLKVANQLKVSESDTLSWFATFVYVPGY